MKCLLASLIGVSILAEALSLTCYRCGGASPSGDCSSSNEATVECESVSLPDAVYGCQVYTVNYTSLSKVQTFKGCCFYEDCDKNPCEKFGKDTVCSKRASCQADKCNKDYPTAKASQRPTLPSKACRVLANSLVMSFAAMLLFFSIV